MTRVNDLGIDMQFGVPPFAVALPPGWVRVVPTNAAHDADMAAASRVFQRAGRPDLDAQLRSLMLRTRQGMSRAKVFAVYRQQDVEMDELLPMSITAAAATAEDGQSLDPWITEAFRARGAEFLFDAPHIVRWSAELPPQKGDFSELGGITLTYVIPVPRSRRTRAVVFTTTILAPAEGLAEDVQDALETLSDTIVSTFTWSADPLEGVSAESAAADPVTADAGAGE